MRYSKWTPLFSGKSWEWSTPKEVYSELDGEFHFTHDPCKLGGTLGLLEPWGTSNFVNPPYGPGLSDWFSKAILEQAAGKTSVLLVPSRTDTRWFHDYAIKYATEIRFIRGRLRFGNSTNTAPFPSMLAIFLPHMPEKL
jgi:hypothetical protein